MTQATPYRGRVRIGVDAAGKPIDKYLTAPTKLELETVKQACREHFILGRPVPEDKMFYEYAEESTTTRRGCSWRSCIISASAGARRWDSSGATSTSPRTRCTSSATWTTPARSRRTAA